MPVLMMAILTGHDLGIPNALVNELCWNEWQFVFPVVPNS